MLISEKHLNEFKVLLKNKMGEKEFNKLSEQDILDSATKLLTLVKIVYKPMTQKEFNIIKKNDGKIKKTKTKDQIHIK